MDFFFDLENYLSKKKIPFSHVILICLFLFFAFFTVLIAFSDGNYSAVIAVFATGLIAASFSREIKKMHNHNQMITLQRDIATNGFDASLFAFFIFGDNGKCVFINRVAQKLFPGFKIRSIEDFIVCFGKYPKVLEAIRNLQIAAANSKQSHIDVPMSLHAEEGVALWRIAVAPIPEHKGFSGWTIIDLTPSTVKIDSPETNGKFLLNLINYSDIGYFCLDEANSLLFCNKTLGNWLGHDPREIVGSNFVQYIKNGDDISDDKRQVANSLPIKVVIKSETGELPLIARKIFVDEKNNRIYMIAKETQQSGELVQALSKTKMYFERIFEDTPIGILITDGAEMIETSNRAAKNIIGASTEIVGTSFLDYVESGEKEKVREKLYQLTAAVYKSIAPFEICFNASAQQHNVMIYVSKIDEEKNYKGHDGLILYLVDISERKALQNQFVQSQKMQAVGQLAGGIAHDFNNLLTAMIGYCDLLLEKYVPSDQSFNDIMQIKQNANRASNLVRQLLAFSRQQTMQPKIFHVSDMISELSALLKRLLGAKIELKVVHGQEVGFIKVDQIQFEQVIINLAVNARDAMKDGGLLTIKISQFANQEPKFLRGETMPPGFYVLIEVSDNGCGINEAYLSRIFDPFFSTKEKGHGTGLGLSTVYGIVNQTGGFISVESEVGVGTKFSLYFPVASDKEITESRSREQVNGAKAIDLTGVGTILLVEDEDAVRMFSARALRDKGYRIVEASNGESAIEFVKRKEQTIDLIITDIVMPKIDGPTLVENVRKYLPDVKVIFISGYAEDGFRNSLANDSKVHFLPKPFNLKELAAKVKEVI